MKLILKDDFIYIVNGVGIVNNKVEAEVFVEYVEDYENKTFEYKLNNKGYTPLLNNKIVFKEEDYKNQYIDLSIRARNSETVQHFRTDRIPITNAIVFGGLVEDAYPESIKTLFLRMDRIDAYLVRVLEVMEIINNKGNLL